MTTEFLTVLAGVWLVSAVANYLLIRREHRQSDYLAWDNASRCGVIFFALLCGPYYLLIALIFFLFGKVAKSRWGKREASW